LTLYGDGNQTRAFCYVDDLIDGFVKFMAAPETVTGPLNLGNPVETSVAELADTILQMTGSRSPLIRRPLPVDDPTQRCPDVAQAQSLLGWRPTTPLKPRPHHRVFRQAPRWAGRTGSSRATRAA
jgi:UDP-glucuronate decarboxylase